jgi:hypothetical protein
MMAAQDLTRKVVTTAATRRAVSTTWLVAIGVAIFWSAIILLVHSNSPRTLVSFHGLLHAAIGGQFLGSSGTTLSLENPFFAGEKLAYYWFFQFLGAQVTKVLGINLFHSFELLIVLWTAGMMITGVFLGRRLYRSAIAGVLLGYLIMAGSNPFGWLFFLRALIRRGQGALTDNPDYLWGIVHPIFGLVRYNDVGGIYGPLVNFFLNITSRPMALASLLMMLFCLLSVIRGVRVSSVLLLTLTTALTTALSPIVGITVVAALLLSCLVYWFLNSRTSLREERKTYTREFMYAAAAMLIGLGLAAPTFYHLFLGPSANKASFFLFSTDGLRHLVTSSMSVSVLLLLALIGLRRSTRENRVSLAIPLGAALTLLILDLCISLQAGNSSNLFHAAVVLLALPASGSIFIQDATGHQRIQKWLVAAIFIVFVPTLSIVVLSYTFRAPISVSFESQVIEHSPKTSDLAVMYQWIKSNTDQRAVFIVNPRDPFSVVGNTSELPAMTQRAIFTENRKHYISAAYPDANRRFDIALRAFSAEQLKPEDYQYLAALKRPILIVNYDVSSAEWSERMQSRYGQAKFARGKLSIYELTLSSQ